MATREEVASVFQNIVQRFDPSKAEGIDAVIQFDLSGDNGGQYWLKIADGKMDAGEGAQASPKMTVKSSGDDLYNMLTGKLNPMQAFMMGKVKIVGDTGLAMKLMPLLS